MVGEQLSKRQDRALHRAFESAVLAQFPNPDRKDCPGSTVLRAIADKRISMSAPALAHVGHCSPCLAELSEFRRIVRRHKMVLVWSPVVAALLVVSVFSGYLANKNNPSPSPPLQALRVATVIDLRGASSARAPQPKSTPSPIEIPRGLLALTIKLPVGSEAGSYEVEIRRPNQPATVGGTAEARVEGGVTELEINLDTSLLPSGEYEFAWRMTDLEWRYYPVTAR